jgi:hypothetical protein
MKKNYFFVLIFSLLVNIVHSQTLSSSPTLTFSNNTGISTDNIASDGEGGSVNILDFDIQIYNILDVNGTKLNQLSWEGTSFYFAGAYTALTRNDVVNALGSKGMLIKSANGAEFRLNQFVYLNWGETSSITNTVKGYRNGNEVASTTFDGYSPTFLPTTISLGSAFNHVDEVRFYISAGGYAGDQSHTNHSINSIQVSTAIPEPPTATQSQVNIDCFGQSTGSASVFASGGTPPYSYAWAPSGGTGATASNLAAGNYTCTITDAANAKITKSFTITQPGSALSSTTSSLNVSCHAGTNGSATVMPSGGTSPYSYSWSPSGGTAATASSLGANFYTCTIIDAKGCSITKSVNIIQPFQPIEINFNYVQNVSCAAGVGGADGRIEVISVTGGTPSYEYNWTPGNPSGDGTFKVFNLAANTYFFTVTDANNCQKTSPGITIQNPVGTFVFAGNAESSSQYLNSLSAIELGNSSNCHVIARLASTAPNPINSVVNAKVWVETSQSSSYVKRHYEITPQNNPNTASGLVTLYFSQQEFDDFNAVNTIKLPIDGADVANNKANLLIEKKSGTSNDNTGLPSSYTGNSTNIDPVDGDVFWNSTKNRWEVSFNTTGFSGFFVKTTTSIIALPLNLLSFTGKATENGNQLNWKTANERDFSHFEIQKSENANTFEKIGAVARNASENYQFADNQASGVNYYRLKMVDLDGKYNYSNTISIENYMGKTNVGNFYPNPSQGITYIDITTLEKGDWNITTFDITGKVTHTQNTFLQKGLNTLTLGKLGKGVNLVKFENKGIVIVRRIVGN